MAERLARYIDAGNRVEPLAIVCGCGAASVLSWRRRGKVTRNDVVRKALDEALKAAGF